MSIKVLAIDDSPPITRAIKIILSKEGFEVFTANDGEEALNKIIEVKPDLVVSDIGMPKLNGFELLEKVRSNPEISSTPFIFLTGSVERRENIEVNGWIFKPFSAQSIVETVKSVLKI